MLNDRCFYKSGLWESGGFLGVLELVIARGEVYVEIGGDATSI